MRNGRLVIREALPSDSSLLVCFIKELAEYEQLSHQVVITEDLIHDNLFGDRRTAEAFLGYLDEEPVAFALFFHSYSTFLGRPGIYLEDLFVRPPARGLGIGREMLRRIARLAMERNCGRLEWSVLNWNEPAIGFYRKLGAEPQDEWTRYRLSGDALSRFAGEGESHEA
jgi:GNAT superfamily N-acetyltransferase